MSLMLFKYALPVVIGYVLCVGISGQLWPLRKPQHLAHRPAWFLGLWAGSAVALTLMLALNMAYHVPSVTMSSLAIPSLSLIAAAIIPGFLVYLWYRKEIDQELISQHRREHTEKYVHSQIAKLEQEIINPNEPVDAYDATWSESFEEIDTVESTEPESEQSHQQSSEDQTVTMSVGENIDAEADIDDEFDAAFDSAYAHTRQKLIGQKIAAGMSQSEQQPEFDIKVSAEELRAAEELERAKQEEQMEEKLLAREEAVRAEMALATDARIEQQTIEHQKALAESMHAAEQECKLREEVENNLRITRKAMVQLEARTRKLEMTRNDELIKLEQQLEDQIRENSKLEAAVGREQQKSADIEAELQSSREELLQVRTELRKNTAARAKALASANKAVTFARQAVDARAQTESKLSSLKDRVITQQTTISSLIKALDTEKTTHKDELEFLKAQLDQKNGELESINKEAPAANQTLTNRLVKKVAKPRAVS